MLFIHFKGSFRSVDIYIFVLIFYLWYSILVQEITARHIMPNILRNKGNQAMKFGQLIENNMENIFLQKLCRK